MKRIILVIVGVSLALIVIGVIYGVGRVSSITGGGKINSGSNLPETNPFEVKSNPFEFFKNPFDDTSGIAGSRLMAQVSAGKATFSTAELGGCASPEECRAFCNQIKNLTSCIDFAEKHSLMSPEDLSQARRFAKAGGAGPGGCTNKDGCENYCSNLDHIEECVVFAEKYGVIPPKELEEAQNIRRYIKEGGSMPGGCKSKESCVKYCKAPANMRVCLDFAERANLISRQELVEARKVVPFMLRGETPGKCISQKECENYCRQPSNFRECLDFAHKAGFLNRVERIMLDQAVKLIPQ